MFKIAVINAIIKSKIRILVFDILNFWIKSLTIGIIIAYNIYYREKVLNFCGAMFVERGSSFLFIRL